MIILERIVDRICVTGDWHHNESLQERTAPRLRELAIRCGLSTHEAERCLEKTFEMVQTFPLSFYPNVLSRLMCAVVDYAARTAVYQALDCQRVAESKKQAFAAYLFGDGPTPTGAKAERVLALITSSPAWQFSDCTTGQEILARASQAQLRLVA